MQYNKIVEKWPIHYLVNTQQCRVNSKRVHTDTEVHLPLCGDSDAIWRFTKRERVKVTALFPGRRVPTCRL